LAPEDFGTIALLYFFTGIANVFVEVGFSSALIQKQQLTRADESTAFCFNVVAAGLCALVLVIGAPLIGRFYGRPILIPLTYVMAGAVILNGLSTTQKALLSRALEFRTQMKISSAEVLVAGSIAITLAFAGFGVWALAIMTLVSALVGCALYWILSDWRPTLDINRESARGLLGFSGYVVGSALTDVVFGRLHTILIGRSFGVAELGYYSRADGTKQMPVSMLTAILSRVAFSVFSRVASEPDRLRRGVQIALRIMMFVNLPTMIGLAFVADPFVVVVFGEKWRPAVPYLQVLCVAGALWPLHVINLNVLIAQGHADLNFRLDVAKKTAGVALLLGMAPHGPLAIAWVQVIYSLATFFVNAHYTKRYLAYGALQQIRDVLPILAICTAMTCALAATQSFALDLPALLQLLVEVIVGILSFGVLAWCLRNSALRDITLAFRPGLVT